MGLMDKAKKYLDNKDVGFRVMVEDYRAIFNKLIYPNEIGICLGSAKLDRPLYEISCHLESDGATYNSIVTIEAGEHLDLENKIKLQIPEKPLASRYYSDTIDGSLIILDSNYQPEYEVLKSDFMGALYILTGNHSGTMIGAKGIAPPKDINTLEDFVEEMKRFEEIIETTVNGLYDEYSTKTSSVLRLGITESGECELDFTFTLDPELRELWEKLLVDDPKVCFDDIGGQDKAKTEVQGLVHALKNPDIYKSWGTEPPRGILLHGPPGTGKTMMAKALASEADATFYEVKFSDLGSMWYSQTQENMQKVFELAKQSGRCILFFDELDSLASQRNYSHEASTKMLSVMLQNLNGLQDNPNLMVVGATNRLEAVDAALTRPGRLDMLIEVGLPDEEARKQIFEIYINKAEKKTKRTLFEDPDLDLLVRKSKGYSGADIAEIVRRTLEKKVREELSTGKRPRKVRNEELVRHIEEYERVKDNKRRIGFKT